MSRRCQSCGFDNPDPRNVDDVWCLQCRAFLGFPTAAPSSAGIQLAVRGALPVTVVAGGEASIPVSVRNTGTVVDEVSFAVTEVLRPWVRTNPNQVNLYPGDTGVIQVVFAPPRSPQVAAGRHELELVATSREAKQATSDEGDPARAETRLALEALVEPFVELTATLVPVHSSGPSGGSHRLVVENRGNHATSVSAAAGDPDELLGFRLTPERLSLGAGDTAEIALAVTPRSPLVGASSRSMPFSVTVAAADVFAGPSRPVGGVHVQEAAVVPLRLLLAERELRGWPGEEVGTFATIRNTAPTAETLHFTLLGPVSEWGRVVPETVVAAPGAEVRVEVTVTLPPPEAGFGGWLPFGLRCVPTGDTQRAAVAEGGLRVEMLDAVEVRVLPTTAHGRWVGRFLVTIRNAGGRPGRWRVIGVDPADELSFALARTAVDLRPGTDTVVAAKVRARRPALVGKSRPLSFSFAAVRTGAEESSALWGRETEAEATFEQLPVLGFRPGRPSVPSSPKPPPPPRAPASPRVNPGGRT